jgi:hypothetical protein
MQLGATTEFWAKFGTSSIPEYLSHLTFLSTLTIHLIKKLKL